MPFVYKEVRTLAGHALVGTGDCVELVKALAPGLKSVPTSAWKPGDSVVDVAQKLAQALRLRHSKTDAIHMVALASTLLSSFLRQAPASG